MHGIEKEISTRQQGGSLLSSSPTNQSMPGCKSLGGRQGPALKNIRFPPRGASLLPPPLFSTLPVPVTLHLHSVVQASFSKSNGGGGDGVIGASEREREKEGGKSLLVESLCNLLTFGSTENARVLFGGRPNSFLEEGLCNLHFSGPHTV